MPFNLTNTLNEPVHKKEVTGNSLKCITLESLQVSRTILQLRKSSRSCGKARGLKKLEGTAAVFENSKGKLETLVLSKLGCFPITGSRRH